MTATMTPPAPQPLELTPTGPAIELDAADRRLLNILQEEFPLTPRPYERIGKILDLTEAETLIRVSEGSKKGESCGRCPPSSIRGCWVTAGRWWR